MSAFQRYLVSEFETRDLWSGTFLQMLHTKWSLTVTRSLKGNFVLYSSQLPQIAGYQSNTIRIKTQHYQVLYISEFLHI